MKRFAVLALVSAFAAPGSSIAGSYSQQHDAVLSQFQSKTEKKARDALWTSASIFKVGVIDDGTDQTGYASYVCEVVAENGLKGRGVWVQIIDIAKLKRTGKWVVLGDSHCR